MKNQIQGIDKESSSLVVRLPGRKYLLTDLGTDLKNFNDTETKIINARQAGVSICDQTKEEIDISLTGIIFKISVVCGCHLPTHDAHINALESEFLKFLNDNGYSGLTPEEIITAFRMNVNFLLPEKIETFNAVFNIDFAAKVLRQYRSIRCGIDEKAEKFFEQRERNNEMNKLETERRKKIIAQFEVYLQNENAELDLENCFMQLRHDGAFSNKNIKDDETNYFRGATEYERLLNSFDGLDSRFKREHETVMFLFRNMKSSGMKRIYDDNMKLVNPGFELPEKYLF